MKKALYVDCCIRGELSRTAQLAKAFLEHLPKEYEVQTLHLDEENLSAFSGGFFAQRERLLEAGELNHPRFRYAHQFAEADLIVIAAPLWDLSFPALLKVYIEQLCVDGITFGSTENGLAGFCKAEHMVYLTTRGGFYTDSPMEMGSCYLDAMHTFFGIRNYTCIAADGMDVVGFDGEASLQDAKCRAAELAGTL